MHGETEEENSAKVPDEVFLCATGRRGEGTAAVASSQNESVDLFGDCFSWESPWGN